MGKLLYIYRECLGEIPSSITELDSVCPLYFSEKAAKFHILYP